MSVRITLKVAEDEADRVQQVADGLGISRQAVYSQAVIEHLVMLQVAGFAGADSARRAERFLRSGRSAVDQETASDLTEAVRWLADTSTKLTAQVRYIGHNVNQLVRRVNAGQADSLDPDALLVVIAQLDDLLDRARRLEAPVAKVQAVTSCL